ncbi:hypothetical protein ACWCQW_47700 [Streptomyces mirabilis]
MPGWPARGRRWPAAEREKLKRLRNLAADQAKTIEILKEGDGLLREGERPVSEIYRFIRAEKALFTVVLLCAVLGVARSSYYTWEAGEQVRSVREREDLALVHEITVIHVASKRTYGVPRIPGELRRQGRDRCRGIYRRSQPDPPSAASTNVRPVVPRYLKGVAPRGGESHANSEGRTFHCYRNGHEVSGCRPWSQRSWGRGLWDWRWCAW